MCVCLCVYVSQLALWQAYHVQSLLSQKFPQLTFKVEPMNTMGDKDQIKPLSDFGSKGVFTKELDLATLNDTIQLAVHCMKDLPTTLPEGLFMGAVLTRGDTEDVLVLPIAHPKRTNGTFEDLPAGSIIGTSAMRRTASLAKYYPELKCENIRGNVNTRLAKLDRSENEATTTNDKLQHPDTNRVVYYVSHCCLCWSSPCLFFLQW